MCGNQAQDATKSHTCSEDAQDARDANLTLLASGCKAGAPDAPYIFAEVIGSQKSYVKKGRNQRVIWNGKPHKIPSPEVTGPLPHLPRRREGPIKI